MDMRVSLKEARFQPRGPVEILVQNVYDIYPVLDTTDIDLIVDIEVLDDDRVELLDRTMFGTAKQRGADPLDFSTGVQWAEAVLGEVPVPVTMQQVQKEVQKEGPGVQVAFEIVADGEGKKYLSYAISLTNSV